MYTVNCKQETEHSKPYTVRDRLHRETMNFLSLSLSLSLNILSEKKQLTFLSRVVANYPVIEV